MKKLLSFLLLIIPILSFSYNGSSFIGKYSLYLPYTSGYQNHFLDIKTFSGNRITGIIGLDFNIGPQARMPRPWEKLHKIPFKGDFDSKTNKITFYCEVKLEENHNYFFKGYLMDIDGYSSIVGIYWVGQKEEGGFFAQKTKKSSK